MGAATDPCDWQQVLQVKQRTKDRHGLVGDGAVSGSGIAENNHHTLLFCWLCEAISRKQIEGARVVACHLRKEKLQSAREVAGSVPS